MSRVQVTFYVEQDDPDHVLGVTEETYDLITESIMEVGGEDINFQKKSS